jgi:hypothetical protein
MINTGQYEQRLGSYWLAKLPDVSSDCRMEAAFSMSVATSAVSEWQ